MPLQLNVMVKKRQRDLDSGTLLGKASVVLSDLRAPKKFTKKSRNSDQLKHAARNLLSGRARPQPTAEDTSEEPLFLLKTVKQTVPKLNEKKAKSKKKSQKHNEPVSVTKSSTIPQTISSKSKEDNSEGEPVSAAPHPILLDESESTAGVTPPQSSGIQEALKSLASSGGYVQDEEEMEEEEIIQHQAVWQVTGESRCLHSGYTTYFLPIILINYEGPQVVSMLHLIAILCSWLGLM